MVLCDTSDGTHFRLLPHMRTSYVHPWLYSYNLINSFGLRNAPSTFQRLMNRVVSGLEGCAVYLDDVVICSNTWEEHFEECSTS